MFTRIREAIRIIKEHRAAKYKKPETKLQNHDRIDLKELRVCLPDGTEYQFAGFHEWKVFSGKLYDSRVTINT